MVLVPGSVLPIAVEIYDRLNCELNAHSSSHLGLKFIFNRELITSIILTSFLVPFCLLNNTRHDVAQLIYIIK